ncbi:hypothetical protein BDV59DRAFT_193326 [Aspergillus ambiguus]|uniref:Zn(II)2Cys6 transcription factor n=1 Tax=Aspergillus ambiguus TaxID=176160 RepID=UPI003CCCC580
MSTQTGRDRSLGGCGTCRSRHTKCDETRPICNVCQLSNLTCTGYDIRLRFVYQGEGDAGEAESNLVRFRRPLYTEGQRKYMSASLVHSFDGMDPNRALMELDEQCHAVQPDDYSLSRGPFSVFRVRPARSKGLWTDDPHSSSPMAPSRIDMVDESFNIQDDTADFLDSIPLDFSLTGIIESVASFSDNIPSTSSLFLDENTPNGITDMDGNQDTIHFQEGPHCSVHPTPFYFSLNNSPPLPEESWPLLTNYRDRVIPLLAPLNSDKKSPWHNIVLPCAMNTLAELAMGGLPSHARSALLYTLLATSATHIQLTPSVIPAEIMGISVAYYKKRALHDLKYCLQKEVSASNKTAKYKDVLMALLSTAILNVFEEDADSMLACLLVTEQFIKRKGLTKPTLSRKVRLLHHCYAYLRIINESIIVSDMSNDPFQQLGVFPDPRATTRASRFRISQWSDTPDFSMTKVKPMQLGQQDLHLEHPGRWDLTMYPEIFGIPESLLNLISHVTRLGNERDLLINSRPGDPCPNPRDFLLRAKMLEKHICGWDSKLDGQEFPASASMVTAMQKALLIFFYRRFYDVEATVLQDQVNQVKELLQSTKASEQDAYMIWPGFIAACEAIQPDLQEYFRGWFGDCFRKTSLPSFQVALSIAESIWSSGRYGGGPSLQWPDIVRSNRRLVIF